MSLEKAIHHGKEHRAPYYGAGRFDWSCRPHGSCPWCARARQWKRAAGERYAQEEINSYLKGE